MPRKIEFLAKISMLKFLLQREHKITQKKKESRHLNNYRKALKISSRKKRVNSSLNWHKSTFTTIRLKEIRRTDNNEHKLEDKEDLNLKSGNLIRHRTKTENLTEDRREVNTVQQEANRV